MLDLRNVDDVSNAGVSEAEASVSTPFMELRRTS